ncbi:MAG TPA: PQQ-binding-like beta-propeller repeat protein [Pirellulales bacterium]|jgi:outer membrane protein assembly factor BamB|nr:PQQ-binding-like beta-propeller repeat protein [Pirellulales bacterium]
MPKVFDRGPLRVVLPPVTGLVRRNLAYLRCAFALVGAIFVPALMAADWPCFRGGAPLSVSSATNLPIQLSDSQAVAWKTPLEGKGVSSPIVIDGRVVVTSASGNQEQRLHVRCFAAKTGEALWERQFNATGRTLCHATSSVAAPTPAAADGRIFAFFSSNDLACLDLDGNLLWYRGLTYDFPAAYNDVGMASSPLVIGDVVIVQIENQGDSFAAGLNVKTGETVWRHDRPREASWSSPSVFRARPLDPPSVLLQAPSGLTALDPSSGNVRWDLKLKSNDITSSTNEDGVIFLPADGITAIQPDAAGGAPKILWKQARLNPGAASPVVQAGRLYVVNRAGVLSCAETAKGTVLWQLRLAGRFWSTPVLAGNHLYLFSDDGLAQVVALGEKGELASSFSLGEEVMTSPAVAAGGIVVRSAEHLWKFAKPAE